jgi:hypothetical protein
MTPTAGCWRQRRPGWFVFRHPTSTADLPRGSDIFFESGGADPTSGLLVGYPENRGVHMKIEITYCGQ